MNSTNGGIVMKETHCEPAKNTCGQRKLLPAEAQRLGKLLSILFWLFIPSGIASIMTSGNMADLSPAVFTAGNVLLTACSLIYGIILIQMAFAQPRYRTAGIFSLLTSAVVILIAILCYTTKIDSDSLIFSIIQFILAFACVYTEYSAHALLLQHIEPDFSDKWSVLWKANIGSSVIIICGIVVLLGSPIFGILLLLVSCIALIVISILKLVYLYRTAKIFRKYTDTQNSENII